MTLSTKIEVFTDFTFVRVHFALAGLSCRSLAVISGRSLH